MNWDFQGWAQQGRRISTRLAKKNARIPRSINDNQIKLSPLSELKMLQDRVATG